MRALMIACLSVNVVVPLAVLLSNSVTAAGCHIAPEWRFETVSRRYYVDNRAGLVGRVAGKAPGMC